MSNTVVEAGRDAILADGAGHVLVTNDFGVTYNVTDAVVDGRRFIVSARTGSIAMLTQTGRGARFGGKHAGMVRVRIDYAVDAERADDTCLFGAGEHIGGWAPIYVFGG